VLRIVGGTQRQEAAARDIRARAAFISHGVALVVASIVLRDSTTVAQRRVVLSKAGVPPGDIGPLLRKYGVG